MLGEPRENVSRHVFVAGNFFMQRMLNRFRDELSVTALPRSWKRRPEDGGDLQSESARIAIDRVDVRGDRLELQISVQNLGGHKLPTAYPSRRAWLHVTVRDASDRIVFESGALDPDGSIQGNDNDADAARFEPHYTEITPATRSRFTSQSWGTRPAKPPRHYYRAWLPQRQPPATARIRQAGCDSGHSCRRWRVC